MSSDELRSLGEGLFLGYLREALENGADGLCVEYDEGYEWIYAVYGDKHFSTQLGIDRLESSTREANELTDYLYELAQQPRWSERQIGGETYWVKVESYELFGELCYNVYVSDKPPRRTGSRSRKKKRSRRKGKS